MPPQAIEPTLISLLAETDELFAPIRDWREHSQVAAILARRDEYRRRGLPYLVGGNQAERIIGYEAATRLEESGAVKFSRTRGKRSFWRLAANEYWRLRWWSLLTGENELAVAVRAIERNMASRCVYDDIGGGDSALLPEWALVGFWGEDIGERTQSRVSYLAEILTPGLVFGWLESESDCHGAVYYRLTAVGADHFADWRGPSFSPPRNNKKLASETADAYAVASIEARQALRVLRTDSRDIPIPLSCGCCPEPSLACPPILDDRGLLVGGSP